MVQRDVHVVELGRCLAIDIVPEVACHDLLIEESASGTEESVLSPVVADMVSLASSLWIGKHSPIFHLSAVELCPRGTTIVGKVDSWLATQDHCLQDFHTFLGTQSV